MNTFTFFRNRKWPNWTADAIALLGWLVYIAQAIVLAHTTISSLDEGAYLYKGLLFAKGIYQPFEPYGVWTNKAPLAFLIPGYVQLLFGAGLRTGRYLAIVEAALALLGLWVTARRMGSRWLAAGAVWVLALSPAVIKVYSVGASQALIACMMAWMLALSLGEKRPLWQLILGSALASLMIFARQNMVLVLPILLLYIFWEHGWKAGAWASLAGISIFVIGHIIYWPGILQLWIPWLPFVPASWSQYYSAAGGTAPPQEPILISTRLLSFLQGFRWHFIVLTGSLFSLLLWPKTGQWKKTAFRAAVFLAVLFFSLLFLHAYASLGKNYCVFCFAPYLSFFGITGLLFVVILIQSWNQNPRPGLQIGLVILVLLFAAGTGYATFEDTGRALADLSIPRLVTGQFIPGFTTFGEILVNKFALDQAASRRAAALTAGLVTGLGIIALTLLLKTLRLKRKYQFGFLLANVFLIVGLCLSIFISGAQGAPDCKTDVIAANEAIGAHLASILPPDSKVYWMGGLSAAPLLYAPQARVYPPQINGYYSFVVGGDSDTLLSYGLWNGKLNQRWKKEADIFIVEEWRYSSLKTFLSPKRFEELPQTSLGTSCQDATHLRIFKRIIP